MTDNKPQQKKPADGDEEALSKIYNSAFLIIADLQNEAARLLSLYGEKSSIVKKKIKQIEDFKAFYSFNKDYINSMRELNYKMSVNYRAMEIIVMKHETGLPWKKCGELLGHNAEDYKKLDNVEVVFSKIRASISELENLKSQTTSEDEQDTNQTKH